MGYLYEACDEISDFCHQYLLRKMRLKSSMCIKINKVGKQEVGIWWVQKRFPQYGVPIWSLWPNIKICVINSCWEKCDEKCAYMFNVYKNQLSRRIGSRNLTDPKMLPTIWHTYMKLVTKYQISAINSCCEKCDEKYLGRTDGRTDRGKTEYLLRWSGGIKSDSKCVKW